LRKGRIENPGNEKMLAIARAMGFPPALWFEDAPTEGRGLAARVQSHFKIIVHPGTGDSYTDAEAVRMGAGVLTEEEVEGIRTGKIADPTVGQVAATFGVEPSYLVDRGTEPSVLDKEVLDALADETANAILRESARLPEREKRIVLGIVREFGNQGPPSSG